jgi:hypothetical protein
LTITLHDLIVLPSIDFSKDLHKKSFFYFNKETNSSQWTHPLEDEYRAKVIQVRQELAMNRIQELGSVGSLGRPPPKSLPPLKKLGSSKPLPGGGALNKLGPIGGASLNPMGEANRLNNNTSSSNNNGGDGSRAGGGDRIGVVASGVGSKRDQNHQSQIDSSLQNPSERMVKKPLSGGLTLTGNSQ